MNMILHTSNDNRLATLFLENTTKNTMQFVAKFGINKKRLAILRGEDCVNQYFGERLWHNRTMYPR